MWFACAYAFNTCCTIVALKLATIDSLLFNDQPRRSIGAECNWGIRFDGLEDAKAFLRQLSQEVSNRLVAAGVRGRGLTLKVCTFICACMYTILILFE